MSELLDKQVNAQKEGSRKLPQAHEKVCDESKKKNDACKNVFHGRKLFITSI